MTRRCLVLGILSLGVIVHNFLRLAPLVTKRIGFSVSQVSVLDRFHDGRTIERVSPRLRDASGAFRFTLRYAF